jgi:GT2 family glycosyltransferase
MTSSPECMPRISVVVPTYNRLASLQRLLHGLQSQTLPPQAFEVVIVDDGSTDATVAVVRQLKLAFTVRVLEQAHAGPAEARNLGVRHAAGAIVVFLDDDVVPEPGLLSEHLRTHSMMPDLVVVGPMLPPTNWQRPPWVRWEEDTLQVQYRDMLDGKYPCTPRQFYTANASLSRERFLAVGGFDSTFKRAEDVELAYRLRDNGARFCFNAAAEVKHYAARSFEAWLRIPYQYGRYDVAMHRDKNQETLQLATYEFHTRNPLTRWITRACVGRPLPLRMAVAGLRLGVFVADRAHQRRVTRPILSGLFNLLYWEGALDELGGRKAVMDAIEQGGHMDRKPDIVSHAVPTIVRGSAG